MPNLSHTPRASSAQRLNPLRAWLVPARALALGLGLLAARPAAALGQTVVLTGDNLPAIVAAAADGDTLILQSNATFVGTLSWTNKFITIKAGPGYSPRIQGSPDLPAINLTGSSNAGSSGNLIGLRLAPGTTSPGGLTRGALETGGTGTPTPLKYTSLLIEKSLLEGDLRLAGTGSVDTYVTLEDTTVQDSIEVGGTGDAYNYVSLLDNCRVEELYCSTGGDAITLLSLTESEFDLGMRLRPSSKARVDVLGQRLRLLGPVLAEGQANTTLNVHLESSLLAGDGSGTGLFGRSFTSFSGANLTVVDYAVGLDVELPGSFANLVLTDLGDCLAPVVLPSQIRRSVIADGTYAGVLGNLGGKPWMDAQHALLAGSIGIDHGDNNATFLTVLDLYGADRFQDNDGDGQVRINCGAVESLGTCASAFSTLYNGSGQNPLIYTAVAQPVVGQSFVGAVQYGPQTVATLVAIGFETVPAFSLAGIEGEILLDLSLFPSLHFANGTHVMPIPAGSQYCGVKIATQGFRIDLPGGIPVARAGNALKLSLGQ